MRLIYSTSCLRVETDINISIRGIVSWTAHLFLITFILMGVLLVVSFFMVCFLGLVSKRDAWIVHSSSLPSISQWNSTFG